MKDRIAAALRAAAEREGWNATRIAATVGKSEASARQWLKGSAEMSASDFQVLRNELPGFANLVDAKVAA